MEFVIDTLPAEIALGATGLTGLMQEVRTVMTTRKGSVPLDREFGLDWSVIDCPIHEFHPRYVADVTRQIEKYVPRVRVVEVKFQTASDSIDGFVHPVVKISIRPEYAHEFF